MQDANQEWCENANVQSDENPTLEDSITENPLLSNLRWAFKDEYISNPLFCLVDHFPSVFLVASYCDGFVKIVSDMFEPDPEGEFIQALNDIRNVPNDCFWAWADCKVVILPFEWLMPIEPEKEQPRLVFTPVTPAGENKDFLKAITPKKRR